MLTPLILLLPFLTPLTASPTPSIPHKRASSQLIRSNRNNQCLSPAGGRAAVAGNQISNGTPLTTVDCASAALWDISPGSGSVILTGTNYALDAGVNPSNNVAMKVWQSYPGVTQQTWYLTADNRIAITGGNQCLDQGPSGPQTYQCITGNTNQIWYVSSSGSSGGGGGGGGTTPPPSSDPNNPPTGTVYADPPGQGRRIHPNGRNDLCVSVMGGTIEQARTVDIAYCLPSSSPNSIYQLWDLSPSFRGQIALHATTQYGKYCLFGGTLPADGAQMNLNRCGTPYVYLNWTYTADGRLGIDNTQACLDVQLNSGGTNPPIEPFPRVQRLQSWTCSPGNPRQVFTLYNGQ